MIFTSYKNAYVTEKDVEVGWFMLSTGLPRRQCAGRERAEFQPRLTHYVAKWPWAISPPENRDDTYPAPAAVKVKKTTCTKCLIKCLTHKGHSTNVSLLPPQPSLLHFPPGCAATHIGSSSIWSKELGKLDLDISKLHWPLGATHISSHGNRPRGWVSLYGFHSPHPKDKFSLRIIQLWQGGKKKTKQKCHGNKQYRENILHAVSIITKLLYHSLPHCRGRCRDFTKVSEPNGGSH